MRTFKGMLLKVRYILMTKFIILVWSGKKEWEIKNLKPGGLGVSSVACHATAPGSNPGAGAFI